MEWKRLRSVVLVLRRPADTSTGAVLLRGVKGGWHNQPPLSVGTVGLLNFRDSREVNRKKPSMEL